MNDLTTALQDADQRIVVSGRDRVELVVVAAGTRYREPLKRLGKRINLIIERVEANLWEFDTVVVSQLAKPPKRRADDRFVDAELLVQTWAFQ